MPPHATTAAMAKKKTHDFMPCCCMNRKLIQNARQPSIKVGLPRMMSKLRCWHQITPGRSNRASIEEIASCEFISLPSEEVRCTISHWRLPMRVIKSVVPTIKFWSLQKADCSRPGCFPKEKAGTPGPSPLNWIV